MMLTRATPSHIPWRKAHTWYGVRYIRRVRMYEQDIPLLPTYKPGRVIPRRKRKNPERLPGETFTDARLRHAYEQLLNVPDIGGSVTRGPVHLDAMVRSARGHKCQHLREFGRVPAVVQERLPNTDVLITIDARDWRDMVVKLRPEFVYNQVFNLRLYGYNGRTLQVYCHRHTMDSVTHNPIHIQFQRFVPFGKNLVRMPIIVDNADVSEVLKTRDGELDVFRQEVLCVWRGSDHMPKQLYVDVRNLAAGKLLRLSDLRMPEGLSLARPWQGRFDLLKIRARPEHGWGTDDDDEEL